MRKILLIALWLLATLATLDAPSAAARDRDYGYRAGPYQHEARGNWSGLYIGAAIGYSYSSTDVTHDWTDIGPIAVSDRYDIGQDGVNATASVGFDLQVSSRFVAGIFADYTTGDIKDRLTLATPGNFGLRLKLDDSWAAGGRLGLVHDGALWYVAAGYTGMNVSFDVFEETLHGYFLGAGLEADIGYNFRLKLEYRYADYGSENFFTGAGCCAESLDIETSVHSVRLGLSYMFGHRQEVRHEPLK